MRSFPALFNAVEVRYDLVDKLAAARVASVPVASGEAASSCLWDGAQDRGAFICPGSRIERRTLEIDYQPRWGVLVPIEPGRRTVVEYGPLPATVWEGGRLWLWFGLHDYHARKHSPAPVTVEVEIDEGLILDVARLAADSVERPAAPLTTYLLGYAAALAGGGTEEVEALAGRAQILAEKWDGRREISADDFNEADLVESNPSEFRLVDSDLVDSE